MLYFTIFLLLFIAGFLDLSDISDTARQIIFWLFIATFCFLSGIRWRTGTDWNSYLRFFNNAFTFEQFTEGVFEYGYGVISYISKSISTDYSVFLAIFGSLTIIIKAYTLRQWRYKEFYLISLLIFYCYYIGDIFPIRQSLALSIILFSGKYVIERKLIPFLFCVFLANSIHTSSFIFLVAYPIATWEIRTRSIIFILLFSVIGGFALTSLNSFEWLSQIPGLADDAQDKLDAYSYMASQGLDTTGGSKFVDSKLSFVVGIVRKVVVLVPIIAFRRRITERFDYFPVYFNLIIFGAVFYFTLGTFIQVLKRGASYFDFFEVLVIPMLIFICKNKWQRCLVYCLIAAYSFSKLYMVLNYYWDLYIPYYTIFDDSIIRDY